MIKKIKLFTSNTDYSNVILEELCKKLEKYGYIISDDDYDLAIAIGGDGTFLKMVKECNFSSNVYYLGINTGTLGFTGEIYPSDIDMFLDNLKINAYKTENISIQETKVHANNSTSHFYSLNEIVIRDKNLNTAHLDIKINSDLLERFVGDGVLISTSLGSTAYNLSFKGSIVYSDLHTLQITPIAPLNSKSYRTLQNSVIIPEKRIIKNIPAIITKDLIVTIDGENNIYDNVQMIETSVKKRKIKCLRMKEYDYTKKVYEKFAKD